jgi:alpha-N-arabinofuranosidase
MVLYRRVLKGKVVEPVQYADVNAGPLILMVRATPLSYEFSCKSSKGVEQVLGAAKTKDLSVEAIGFEDGMCFTGVYFGMYAAGNGKKSTTPAYFDWFEYIK